MTLVLVVHDHQPVGNFEHVFQACYDEAYAPFLAFLEGHPRLRLALHTSGPLLQWIGLHHREYLGRLRKLVERGQVELWGGGFFEPVLVSIPEDDRRGQIEAMADWLELELGQRPRGAWLTERVWEPGLATSLANAGVEYTALDDAHFVAAGLERDQLWGHWLTEDQGRSLTVFPIHRELRYSIPFAPPAETIDILRRVAEGGENRIAVLGDDGEKFGVWPGTHKLAYQDGWLERFAEALEANPWIEIRTPAEAIVQQPPEGLVYLPTASYHEMGEWSLPPAGQARYHDAAEALKGGFGDATHDLLRGGTWRNFQARYPEANRPHKRVQRASRKLREKAADEGTKAALTHLWRAQCNDIYWHGVFGGLYLPHLRGAIYRELIEAESFVSGPETRLERGDLDLDGAEDALLETPRWAAWIGSRGARLWGFDDRRALVNYGDTLARRPEYYHARLRDASVGGGEGESIHSDLRVKEPGLAALVERYDERGRDSFLDRWREGDAAHDLSAARWLLADGPGPDVALALSEGTAPAIAKRYAVSPDGSLEVEYTLSSAQARRGSLEVELNLGLHVPQADDRWVEVDGARAEPPHFAARGRHDDVRAVAFVDQWADRRLVVTLGRAASVERAPIETVSLSEAGAEKVFQGLELTLRFDAALEAGKPWPLVVRLAPLAAGTAA